MPVSRPRRELSRPFCPPFAERSRPRSHRPPVGPAVGRAICLHVTSNIRGAIGPPWGQPPGWPYACTYHPRSHRPPVGPAAGLAICLHESSAKPSAPRGASRRAGHMLARIIREAIRLVPYLAQSLDHLGDLSCQLRAIYIKLKSYEAKICRLDPEQVVLSWRQPQVTD